MLNFMVRAFYSNKKNTGKQPQAHVNIERKGNWGERNVIGQQCFLMCK